MRRYRYRHHGLTLDSNQALPNLAPARELTADITIDILEPGRAEIPGQPSDAELPWAMVDPPRPTWRAQTSRGSRLRLRYAHEDEWAEFVVDERGGAVRVTRTAGVLITEAAELLLGPVFSCVLAQRGLTCVHAAVVELEGQVIALVGPSGAGKSTTALALLKEGARLVCDDVAVLTEHGGRPGVIAGTPRMRMRADSARSLLGAFDSLDPIWADGRPGVPKRYVDAVDDAASSDTGRFALDALYFLVPRSEGIAEPSLQALTPVQALSKLMAHRHVVGALGLSSHRRDFEVLGRVAETVPAHDLVRPEGVETAQQVAAAIVADVHSLV